MVKLVNLLVSAINGKDIEVVFNKELDKLTAETKANFEISVNNASALASSAYTVTLDEKDAKKVHITLADTSALDNGAYVSIKVKKEVLDTKLKPLAEDTTKTLTFVDNSAAKIEKVVVDGNDLKVTFNDYVSAVGLVKVNGVAKTPVVATSPYTKVVTVTNGAQGLGNGTYTVQLANVEDIANINGTGNTNVTSFANDSFVISSETVAPSVSKVEKVDANTFKLTFNKDVTVPTVTAKKGGLDLTVSAVNATGDAKVWTVDVADNGGVKLYNTNETLASLAVNVSGFKAVSNNVVGDASNHTVTLSQDTEAPTVQTRFSEVAHDAVKGDVFHIYLNEEVTLEDASKIVVTDKDGIRKTVTGAAVIADANGDDTILEVEVTGLQTANNFPVGNYTVSLGAGAIADLSSNKNVTTSVALAKTGAVVSDLSVSASASGNVITIPYATDMTNSALDKANYAIDNKSLPAGTLVYFDSNKQTVKIELPESSILNNDDIALSISSNVVSTSGAKLNAASRNQVVSGLVDNVKPTLVSAKKLTSTTIEATFSENLAPVLDRASSQNDFVVKVNGVNFTVTAVTDGSAGDKKVVLTVDPFNVDQTITVAMADSAIEIADIATNTATAKTSVTATK
ncbi:hypothetical protein ACIQXQ_01700 [Peribacillus sp. NPDC097198]|uniref:hypothetical protein n=1 Tax=Peribacillus sp. NPDC097198 TaxID=3364397 RepID=UPI00381CAA48